MPSGFDGRAGAEMSTGYIFSLRVLAASMLVGGKAGVGGARTGARCEPGLLLLRGGAGAQGARAGALRELGFSLV